MVRFGLLVTLLLAGCAPPPLVGTITITKFTVPRYVVEPSLIVRVTNTSSVGLPAGSTLAAHCWEEGLEDMTTDFSTTTEVPVNARESLAIVVPYESGYEIMHPYPVYCHFSVEDYAGRAWRLRYGS